MGCTRNGGLNCSLPFLYGLFATIIDVGLASWVFLVCYVSSIGSSNWISKHIQPKTYRWMLYLSQLLMLVAIVLTVLHHIIAIFVAAALIGIASRIKGLYSEGFILHRANENEKGAAIATLNMFSNIGSFVGLLYGGWIESNQGVSRVWVSSIPLLIFSLIVLPMVLRMIERRKSN
ncbi:MFS transporter [Seinonella peptonophila]|uniref:MFS transporter n=1 Tax=Seinonella peptonophila TaxID=112248 RepID=UPI003BF46980